MLKARPFVFVLMTLFLLSFSLPPARAVLQPGIIYHKAWGSTGDEEGIGVATDSSGNVYVAGWTNSFGAGGKDALLLKYDATGSLQWARTWGGVSDDVATAVVVDASGYIYVTGYTNSFGTNGTEVFLLKYTSIGNLAFQVTWGGKGSDYPRGIAWSSQGYLYVVGYTDSFGASTDVFLLKFDTLGSLRTQLTWGGPGDDEAYGVAVDPSGNVYATGVLDASLNGGTIFLLKYTPATDPIVNLVWQQSWGDNVKNIASAIAVDASGNSYVTGYIFKPPSSFTTFLLKYDTNGLLIWQKSWLSNDVSTGIAVDPQGNIYLAAQTQYTYHTDVSLGRLDSTGTPLWTLETKNPTGFLLSAGLAIDPSGNLLMTGIVPTVSKPSFATTYTPNGGSNTLTAATATPAFASVSVLGTLHAVTGTVSQPMGNENYAGGNDVFLFKYGLTAATPLSPFLALVAILPFLGTAAYRRRILPWTPHKTR